MESRRQDPQHSFGGGGPMNRRGLSMVEVMIAMVLSVIAISIAFIMLKDEHSNFVRVRSRIRMQSDAREALKILENDLRNMGLKRANLYSRRDLSVIQCPDAWIASGDSSSFQHINRSDLSNPGDEIVFGMYPPDENGTVTCHSTNLLFVRYRLRGDSVLTRATATSQAGMSMAPDVPLLENVLAFQLQYGLQAPFSTLWNSSDGWSGIGSLAVNGDAASGWSISGWKNSLQYAWILPAKAVKAGNRVRATFQIFPNLGMADTADGRPQLVVGFLEGSTLKDTISLDVGDTTGHTITVDLVATSDMASAHLAVAGLVKGIPSSPVLKIKQLFVQEMSTASYAWLDDPTTDQKRQVRAVRAFLLPRSREKSLPSKQDPWVGIGDLPPYDPGASLGGKAASLFVRSIPVVNNGF